MLVDGGLNKGHLSRMEDSPGHPAASALSRSGGTRVRAFAGVEPLDARQLAAARNRDPEALDRFFQTYAPAVFRLAARMVGDPDAAEDVAQEVFYRVHRVIDRLDVERDPEPWLVAITCNACRQHWRTREAERRRTGAAETRTERELPASSSTTSETLEKQQQIEAVQKALLDLPDALRETIVLRAYQGLGHEEVARALGISQAAARKRYSRAVAELSGRLARWLGREHP